MATRAPSDPDNDTPEPALIEAAQGGDARAFETLLRRHEARVLRVLRLLGVPAGTVKTRMMRAKPLLREQLA